MFVVYVLAVLAVFIALQASDAPNRGVITQAATLPTTTTIQLSVSTTGLTTTSTRLPSVTEAKRAPEKTANRGAPRTPASSLPQKAAGPITPTTNCSSSKTAAHSCWDGLIGQYPWNRDKAFRVMWCESTGNPNARNPHSTARGLFQILGGPLDPQANVALAYKMYSQRGWSPWVCQ